MHFEHFLISGDNGGDAAHIDDGLANTLDIESLAAQQEDYFVAKLFLNRHTAFFGLSTRSGRLSYSGCRGYHSGRIVRPGCYHTIESARFAAHGAPDTFEDSAETLAAGVYPTGLFERWQKLRCIGHRLTSGGDDLLEHADQVIAAFSASLRGFGTLAHDSENGSFHRFDDAPEGEARCFLQRGGEIGSAERVLLVQSLPQSAQGLCENDAGVATCPEQRAVTQLGVDYSRR